VRSALLTAVSHDLRTPIAGIKAAASGLRQADVEWSDEDRAELLAAIEDGSDALAALVDDILAVSRIKAGAVSVHLGPVSVEDALSRVLAEHPGAEVTAQIPRPLPDVRADEVLLQRVMANLLENARRFTPPTRAVEVVAEAVSGVASRPAVQIRIVDHGSGVPEDRWQEMFAPFQRLGDTTIGGLGLGLAIAKGLTEAMSGTLTPQRTPGGGLTMCIELPAAS
jgi:two-component system sensor histidine kinase KdpD